MGKKKDVIQFTFVEIVPWSSSHFSKLKTEAKLLQKKKIQEK